MSLYFLCVFTYLSSSVRLACSEMKSVSHSFQLGLVEDALNRLTQCSNISSILVCNKDSVNTVQSYSSRTGRMMLTIKL